ncbi:sorting nexin-17 isoform X2 [Neocloeon triangulifer]|uniref:sorting nexin-17 isoform X2 n=1 Tax=Neocloeon triangulifer TaxID=2078957 RepID=UPI00286F4B81|nr:sorting nexin-17 isoform X2 [Neocloeon triangulifer]
MHFAIPDTVEFTNSGGSVFVGFNVHINGTYHCSVRYRQLLCLHEQLKRELEQPHSLPPFPPKKLLPLSQGQLDERRLMLEKYLQTASQDPRVASSDLFKGFLLSAQLESSKETSAPVTLDVHLMSGQKISLEVITSDPSDEVLENLSQKLHLAPEFVKFFSLFLIRKDDDGSGEITVIKKLENYESPYISLKSLPGLHRVVLRKNFWDLSVETMLAEDRVALNLLYTQAIWEVERGWILTTKDVRNKLSSLQSRGEKREYLEVAKGLKYYGFVQFGECWCDYPHKGTRVLIAAGNKELNFRVRLQSPDASSSSSSSDSSESVSEGSFRVTRMRCWRITTLHADEVSEALDNCVSPGPRLELSFEYLMAKDRLQWITVVSEQAILMSACLQAMVAELLAKKGSPSTPKAPNRPWSFMRRDGTFHRIRPVIRSVSSDAISEVSVRSQDSTVGRHDEGRSSIKRLSGRLSGMSLKGPNSPSTPANPFVENDAFDGIGDDDL